MSQAFSSLAIGAALLLAFLLGIAQGGALLYNYAADTIPVIWSCEVQVKALWRAYESLRTRQDRKELQWLEYRASQRRDAVNPGLTRPKPSTSTDDRPSSPVPNEEM